MAGFFGRLLGAINPFREKGTTELAEDISKKSETELIELGKLFSHAKGLAFLLFKKPYSDALELTKTVNEDNTKKFLLYFGKVSGVSEQLHRTANSAKKNSAELKSELESLRIKIEGSRLKTAPAYRNFLGAFNKWMDERAKLEVLFGNITHIASTLIQLSAESAIAGKGFEYGKPNEKLERGLELERKSLYRLIKQLLMLYRLMPAVVLANKELKMALERIVNLDVGEQKEYVEYYRALMKKARVALLTACVYAGVTVIPSTLKAPFPSNIANLIAQQEVAAEEENTPQISDAEIKQELKKGDPYQILKGCKGMVFIDYDERGYWKERYFKEVFQDNIRDKKPVLALFYTKSKDEKLLNPMEAIVFKKIFKEYGNEIKMVAVNLPLKRYERNAHNKTFDGAKAYGPDNSHLMGSSSTVGERREKKFPPIRGPPSIAMYSPYNYLEGETPQNNDGNIKLLDVSFGAPYEEKYIRAQLENLSFYWIGSNLFGRSPDGKISRLNNTYDKWEKHKVHN